MNDYLKSQIFDYIYPIAYRAERAKGTPEWDERYTELTYAFQEVSHVMGYAHETARKHVKQHR